MTKSFALIPLAVLLLGGIAAGQGDTVPGASGFWNQWRGPDRSGQCPGPRWPERLNKENFKEQWKVSLGPSYSGPVVDAKHVYTTETKDKKSEITRAYDRLTGKEVWSHEWTGAMSVPFFAARNGSWIRSTPALDETAIYVAGMRDVLVCIEKNTGKERWSVDFTKRYKTGLPSFGFVCSPLLHGDHVYVQAGASFIKLDKKTGKSVWRSLEDAGGMFGSAFSSPVMATIGGQKQLVVQTRTTLNGIADDDGRTLWGIPVRAFRGMNILTPMPWREGVFTSAYGGRAHYFAVANGNEGFTVAEQWNAKAQGNMTSPVIVDDHAYLYLRSKRLTCVSLETGEPTWLTDNLGDTYWSLLAQGKRILALTDGGQIKLIAANPKEYQVIDTMDVSESSTWAHLAVDHGQVFVRDLAGLTAWSWPASR